MNSEDAAKDMYRKWSKANMDNVRYDQINCNNVKCHNIEFVDVNENEVKNGWSRKKCIVKYI